MNNEDYKYLKKRLEELIGIENHLNQKVIWYKKHKFNKENKSIKIWRKELIKLIYNEFSDKAPDRIII